MTTDELKRHQELKTSAEALNHFLKDPENNWKDIQVKGPDDKWFNYPTSAADKPTWNMPIHGYRIRPQPRVVPWTAANCPIGRIVISPTGNRGIIVEARLNGFYYGEASWSTYEYAAAQLKTGDGSPAGTVEEVRE